MLIELFGGVRFCFEGLLHPGEPFFFLNKHFGKDQFLVDMFTVLHLREHQFQEYFYQQ